MRKFIYIALFFIFIFWIFHSLQAYEITKKDNQIIKKIENKLFSIIDERDSVTPEKVERLFKKVLTKKLSERKRSLIGNILESLQYQYFLGKYKMEDINKSKDSEIYEYIQDQMKQEYISALAILVFNEDGALYEKYIGTSHIQKDISLEEDHLFLLASISKTITATALLQLYEKWEFQLDDEINDYLPFDVHHPFYDTPITFRMLLTHTSGIADGGALDDQYYYWKDSPVELSYFLENYFTPGWKFYDKEENFHDFEPGSENEYSNEGTALIWLLVEEISGMSFNEYCKKYIFEPLGMDSTYWRLDEISSKIIVQPYEGTKSIEHYTFTDYPNGGLRSTVTDMSYFLQAFAHDGVSRNYQLLKPQTIKQILTLQVPKISEDMGLHMFYMNTQFNIWGHDGWEQGASTIMGINLDTGIGVIILTNQSDVELDTMLEKAYSYGAEIDKQ